MSKEIAVVSKETIKLCNYIKTIDDGEVLSFSKIQHDTGIQMTERGKQYLRSALKREKKEYSSIRGYGIKLADPEITMHIVSSKIDRIGKAVKRGEKTHKNLVEQFYDDLKPQEQKQILFVGAAFGAIRVASENSKLFYKKSNICANDKKIEYNFANNV